MGRGPSRLQRARLARLFEQPHDFRLLCGLYDGLGKQADRQGVDSLTGAEQVLLHTHHTIGIVENGGFAYFFEHSLDGDAVASAFETAGLREHAHLVRLALEMREAGVEVDDRWSDLAGRFYRDSKTRDATLAEYVRAHREEFRGLFLPERLDDLPLEPAVPGVDASVREVALWILRIEGRLNVADAACPLGRFITSPEALPAGAFEIKGVRPSMSRSTTDNDLEAMSRLHALEGVARVDLSGTNVGKSGMEALCCWKRLREVDLNGTSIPPEALRVLSDLPELEGLQVCCDRLDDSGLEQIARCSRLRTLGLSGDGVTDVGVERLRSLAHLEGLFLRASRVTDDGLGHVGTIRTLRSLSLTAASDVGVGRLSGLLLLEELGLSSTSVSDRALETVGRLAKLRFLDLSCCAVGDRGVLCLAGLSAMEDLRLYRTQVGDRGVEALRNMPHLRMLSLAGTRIARPTALEDLAYLEELYLDDSAVGNEALAHLRGLPKLATLFLDKTKVTDEGLRHLVALPALRCLSLAATGVTGEGFGFLARLPKLDTLWLGKTPVGDAGVMRLMAAPALRTLDLRETRITTGCIDHLRRFAALESVDLMRTAVDYRAGERFGKSLERKRARREKAKRGGSSSTTDPTSALPGS